MSEIKNSWLDQYGAEPSEQQQFGTAGVAGVELLLRCETAKVLVRKHSRHLYLLRYRLRSISDATSVRLVHFRLPEYPYLASCLSQCVGRWPCGCSTSQNADWRPF